MINMEEETVYKRCPGCLRYLEEKHFSRESRHSGLTEKNFVFCTKCVGFKNWLDKDKTDFDTESLEKRTLY